MMAVKRVKLLKLDLYGNVFSWWWKLVSDCPVQTHTRRLFYFLEAATRSGRLPKLALLEWYILLADTWTTLPKHWTFVYRC